MSEEKNTPIIKETNIDLVTLMAKLWKARKVVLKITLLFTILGLTIALLTPNTYQANSVFITQTNSEKPSGSLGGLASLAGINLGGMVGNNPGISSALYPKIFYALPFRKATLEAPLVYQGTEMTYSEYLNQKPVSIINVIKKYTFGLPGQISKWIKGNKENVNSMANTSYGLRLSDREFAMIQSMEGKITLAYNEMEGYNTLSVKDTDPEIAAQLAKWLEDQLQEKIIAFKIQNTQALFDFTEEQFTEKQMEVYELQGRLASFTEQNQNINSAFVRNELRRLESEYDMLNAVYTELAKQKEEAALQLKKDTPIFTIINPVTVPNEKVGTSGVLILMIFVILGFMLAVCVVFIKEPIKELRKAIQKENS